MTHSFGAGLQCSRFLWVSDSPEDRHEQTLSWTNRAEARKVAALAAHLLR